MRVRRLPVTDRVDSDGESLVLVGNTVVRLSPLATRLLDHCEDWTEVRVLAERLVGELGPPPDGMDVREAVEYTVDALAGQGLVERG